MIETSARLRTADAAAAPDCGEFGNGCNFGRRAAREHLRNQLDHLRNQFAILLLQKLLLLTLRERGGYVVRTEDLLDPGSPLKCGAEIAQGSRFPQSASVSGYSPLRFSMSRRR